MIDLNIPKCLSKNCARPSAPALQRGLCLVCYSKAKTMVEAGTTTWAEIVALGLALQTDADGGDPFTCAFNEAKKAKKAKDAPTAAE